MKDTGMAGVTHITPNERAEAITEVFSGDVHYYPFGMQMPGRHGRPIARMGIGSGLIVLKRRMNYAVEAITILLNIGYKILY